MLSKTLRTLMIVGRATAPTFNCASGLYVPKAFFADANQVSTKVDKKGKPRDLSFYVEGQIQQRSQLVLKKQEDIDGYVKKLLSGYFRTTNRANIQPENALADHGIDSLDVIELCMQMEEDLGYKISAETLSSFHKVKHFSNYIRQVEDFKNEYKKEPIA
mmetsp:Transcript_101329/g.140740  ORF Transcript_101329/g.140740 Transcript_101329/m.140740 type:complete len:160 (-) Transcript_101329:174-653(-)